MKRIITFIFCLFVIGMSKAQQSSAKPKLVVAIVVDQMRYDYLERFSNTYTDNGFKRFLKQGYNFKNTHYNYVPTYTAPGHASIFTGTSPMNHGIISNSWYDKFEGEQVYCVSDDNVNPIGVDSKAGKMSPFRMKTMSVADQLRLHTQMKSKVIGIALKDRGAILPAGHSANAAYWFEGKNEGKWITSSHYMNKLPKWVKQFNKKTSDYIKVWDTYLPKTKYIESGLRHDHFEGPFKTKETAIFPYNLIALASSNNGFDIIKASPFGNEMTTDFAIEAIKQEKLGQGSTTDLITISYSSTDYVGHQFGVNSVELQDTYVRLDRDLDRLFNVLDSSIGKSNYTVILTADHGAVHVPSYLKEFKIPAGYFNKDKFKVKLNNRLEERYNTTGLIENISNNQIFLDRKEIENKKLDLKSVQDFIAETIIDFKHIDKVFTAYNLIHNSINRGIGERIQNGFNQKRSGDVVYVLDPAVIDYPKTGSTHGSGYSYDTHVPLLFFGAGIKKGETVRYIEIIDIAPTLSAFLGIAFPNGATGQPIVELFE